MAPEAAPSTGETTAAESMANLEPMPTVGPSGFIGGLPYFFNVFLSKLIRSVVISKFRGEIKVEQRKLMCERKLPVKDADPVRAEHHVRGDKVAVQDHQRQFTVEQATLAFQTAFEQLFLGRPQKKPFGGDRYTVEI